MKTITKKKTMIAAILLTAIAVFGLSFTGAFASTLTTAVSPTPLTVSPTPPAVSPTPTIPPVSPPIVVLPIKSTWVSIDGDINSWGSQVAPVVKGTLTVLAATTSKGGVPSKWYDSADAVWTNTTKTSVTSTTGTSTTTTNSYNYYAARLVKATRTAINFQGNNFYLNGTWNVNNVTVTRTITKTDGSVNIQSNTQITRLETKDAGQLNVTGSWTQFTLSIKGIPMLDGSVQKSIERQTVFNRYDITNGGTVTTVTKVDLKMIESDYGAVPGVSNYDESMDFHGTYQIDICDISTVAANVQP